MLRSTLFVCSVVLFAACIPSPDFYFQKEVSVPGNEWYYNFRPEFRVNISDTTVKYQPFLLLQHTQAYPYSNIWLWMYVKSPGDTVARKERINVVLTEASGKWLGRGMGEIYEQRMPVRLSDTTLFRHKGEYVVSIEQNMRINPLPEILHVGFRLQQIHTGE